MAGIDDLTYFTVVRTVAPVPVGELTADVVFEAQVTRGLAVQADISPDVLEVLVRPVHARLVGGVLMKDGTPGVDLLSAAEVAIDGGFSYTATFTNTRLDGKQIPVRDALKDLTFEALDSAGTFDLKDAAPIVSSTAVPAARGPRGFRTRAVPVNPTDPNTLYQWVDDNGDDVGDPVALADIVAVPASGITDSTTVGRAVVKAASQAAARTAIGAEVAGASKTMNDITDATAVGKAVVQSVDQASARAATGAKGFEDGAQFPITKYGAKQAVWLTDAAMTSGSKVLSTARTFTGADVGKVIGVRGAGPVSADYSTLANDGVLVSTIASVSGGVATLADAASTTCSGARAIFGTPIDTALEAADAAAVAFGGGTVFVPPGIWMGARQVVLSSSVGLTGAGKTCSRMYYVHSDDGSSYDVTPWLYWNRRDPVDNLRHDVNLSNVLIDGQFYVQTAGYSFRAKLILIDGTLDSHIRNCSILNSPATGIGYDVSQRCIIEGNTVINGGRFAHVNSHQGNSSGSAIGIAVIPDALDVSIVIRDNFLFGNWKSSAAISSGRSGINIEGVYSTSSGVSQPRTGSHLISGNVIEGYYAGIRDSGALSCRIVDNEVRKCQRGIMLSSKGSSGSRMPLGTIVRGNVIRDGVAYNLSTGTASTSTGIELNTSGTTVTDPDPVGRYIIEGNQIFRIPGHGIWINGATVSSVIVPVNSTIVGMNAVHQCGGYGIYVSGSVNDLSLVHNLIDGNNTQGLGVYGVYVNNGAIWNGGIIAGNRLIDRATTPTQTNTVTYGGTATVTNVERYGNTGDPSVMDESYARKTGTTTITSSTTVADVADMTLPMAAGGIYQLDATIEYTAPAAVGVKLFWTIPSGASIIWHVVGPGSPTTLASGVTAVTLDGVDSATSIVARVRGTITMSSTAGSIQLQAAQKASNASSTTVTNRSVMELRRVA